jgi:hypothetical protein
MLTRRSFLDAGGFHFPFPAMGTIAKEANGYEFKPI